MAVMADTTKLLAKLYCPQKKRYPWKFFPLPPPLNTPPGVVNYNR